MDALKEYEIKELANNSEEEKQSWTVDSLDSANWAFRKISALKEKIESNKRLVLDEKERINAWEQKENSSHKQSIDFFEQKIAEYHRELLVDDPKAKIKTPYGTASLRKSPTKIEYGDNTVNELKELGLCKYIRVNEEVNKAELKKSLTITEDLKAITEDGEVLNSAIVTAESYNTVVKTEG